jgi:CRISPR-associated endonuclease/helicase Cas3
MNFSDVKSNKKKSISYIYDKDIYNRSVNILKDYTGRPLAEREKNEYINRVY